jgi:hypothetical protein
MLFLLDFEQMKSLGSYIYDSLTEHESEEQLLKEHTIGSDMASHQH